jgi:DNA-binding response OmpR family regulator
MARLTNSPPFELLTVLIEHRGRALSKAELLAQV